MANRWATSTFVITLASGASHLVILGAHRDSTHEAVTTAAALFSASPPAPALVHPRLAAYLAAYPDGQV